jgi:tRNA(Ile)-lysidine synthase
MKDESGQAGPTPVSAVRECLGAAGRFPGLVVALSGGPDSVALARAVLLERPDPAAPVVLAHANHQLRGEESDGDEAFVVEFHADLVNAGANALYLARTRLDVRDAAREQGGNLEAVARTLRYRWLTAVAREHRIGLIATGHTASDQAETVLHHILRGTGLSGLRGISRRRELEPGIEVIRPLLSVSHQEILDWLAIIGQSFRYDSSNSDDHYTRNRLRNELLPHLRQHYNPRIDEGLVRLARQAEEVCQQQDEEATELLARAELPQAGALVILDVRPLGEAEGRLVRAVLRRVWQREGWPRREMGLAHWQRLEHLVQADEGGHDLPGKIHARRLGHVLQLGPR